MATRLLLGSSSGSTPKYSAKLLHALISYQAIGVIVAAIEAAMVTFGSALSKVSYDQIVHDFGSDVDIMVGVGFLSSVLYISAARSAGLYRLPALIQPGKYLGRISAVCSIVLLTLTALLFLLKIGHTFSRGGMLGFAALMLLLAIMTRFVAAIVIESLLARDLILGRPALLIGELDELAPLTSSYLLRHFGLRDVARVTVDKVEQKDGNRRSQVGEASRLARVHKAKEFVVAVKGDRPDLLKDIEEGLRKSPLRVRLLPNSVFRSAINRQAGAGESSVHLIDLQRAPMGLGEQIVKRAVDIVLSAFALMALLPLIIITAIAIKMDSPGPVIFRQRRNGFDENRFVIFKFRTMTVQEDGAKVIQAQRNDRRVTRVGQVLRRTSIDELPQFYNVLKGDMSIVGPRPHALAHDDQYKVVIGDYYKRHHVKPGITGWAQVNGCRGETSAPADMQSRIDYDVWYINNWSLLLDFRILIRTCLEVVNHDAY